MFGSSRMFGLIQKGSSVARALGERCTTHGAGDDLGSRTTRKISRSVFFWHSP